MKTTFYLVESINGNEFNIFSGSEKECNTEMHRIERIMGVKANPMYVTTNRFD